MFIKYLREKKFASIKCHAWIPTTQLICKTRLITKLSICLILTVFVTHKIYHNAMYVIDFFNLSSIPTSYKLSLRLPLRGGPESNLSSSPFNSFLKPSSFESNWSNCIALLSAFFFSSLDVTTKSRASWPRDAVRVFWLVVGPRATLLDTATRLVGAPWGCCCRATLLDLKVVLLKVTWDRARVRASTMLPVNKYMDVNL